MIAGTPSEFYRLRYPNGRVVPTSAKRGTQVPPGNGRAIRMAGEAYTCGLQVVGEESFIHGGTSLHGRTVPGHSTGGGS